MKLIFAIVQNDDSKRLIRELVKHHISVTRISSTGGFLHGGNSTLMIGVEKESWRRPWISSGGNPAYAKSIWSFPPRCLGMWIIRPPRCR